MLEILKKFEQIFELFDLAYNPYLVHDPNFDYDGADGELLRGGRIRFNEKFPLVFELEDMIKKMQGRFQNDFPVNQKKSPLINLIDRENVIQNAISNLNTNSLTFKNSPKMNNINLSKKIPNGVIEPDFASGSIINPIKDNFACGFPKNKKIFENDSFNNLSDSFSFSDLPNAQNNQINNASKNTACEKSKSASNLNFNSSLFCSQGGIDDFGQQLSNILKIASENKPKEGY